LQELIAPKNITFFNSCWQTDPAPGGSTRSSLVSELSHITKIDEKLLGNIRPLRSYCVAQKLSWASNRETTRIEDTAYCLLGILGLSMSLLYGEGERAFRRLQEEIIRSSTDLSVLAWKMERPNKPLADSTIVKSENAELSDLADPSETILSGIFAQSPAEFFDCREYERSVQDDVREFSASNVGLKIRARLLLLAQDDPISQIYMLPLYFSLSGVRLGLQLRKVGRRHYVRRDPGVIVQYQPEILVSQAPTEIFLLGSLPPGNSWSYDRFAPMKQIIDNVHRHTLSIVTKPILQIWGAWPSDFYDKESATFFITEDPSRRFNTIDITWHPRMTASIRASQTTIQCKILALDWSGSNSTDARFSVISSTSHEEPLRRIQDLTIRLDRPPEQLRAELDAANIPQTHVYMEKFTNSDRVAVIGITPVKLMASSGRSHYEIGIHARNLGQWCLPDVEQGTWLGEVAPDVAYYGDLWYRLQFGSRGGYN
jgi:hypothetical protein